MTIHNICFSPTGGTRRVCDILCSALGTDFKTTDLCAPKWSAPKNLIGKDDLVVIGMPVFAGRVPKMAVERLSQMESNGAKCVIVTVFGNRAIDDALLEMQDVAGALGYNTVAAIAAVAEHSIAREYGTGRPDAADAADLTRFASLIKEKLESTEASSAPLNLPGNRPYRPENMGPFPEAGDGCTACGTCAEMCPAGAIDIANPKGVDKTKCISCMRCVSVCPAGARSIGAIRDAVAQKLKAVCETRKENAVWV